MSSLEERVEKLEKEVERLRNLLEQHLHHHGWRPQPIKPKPNIPPKHPFKPNHDDLHEPFKID